MKIGFITTILFNNVISTSLIPYIILFIYPSMHKHAQYIIQRDNDQNTNKKKTILIVRKDKFRTWLLISPYGDPYQM